AGADREGLRPGAGEARGALRPRPGARGRRRPGGGTPAGPLNPSRPAMRSSAGVQHIDLVVSSIERSLPFYRELLAPLGFHPIGAVAGARGATSWYLSGER